MALMWKRVLSVHDERESLTASVFGPLMKLEVQTHGHLNVKTRYYDHNGICYKTEAALEAHMTKLAKK